MFQILTSKNSTKARKFLMLQGMNAHNIHASQATECPSPALQPTADKSLGTMTPLSALEWLQNGGGLSRTEGIQLKADIAAERTAYVSI
jgi:hypothetical protein